VWNGNNVRSRAKHFEQTRGPKKQKISYSWVGASEGTADIN